MRILFFCSVPVVLLLLGLLGALPTAQAQQQRWMLVSTAPQPTRIAYAIGAGDDDTSYMAYSGLTSYDDVDDYEAAQFGWGGFGGKGGFGAFGGGLPLPGLPATTFGFGGKGPGGFGGPGFGGPGGPKGGGGAFGIVVGVPTPVTTPIPVPVQDMPQQPMPSKQQYALLPQTTTTLQSTQVPVQTMQQVQVPVQTMQQVQVPIMQQTKQQPAQYVMSSTKQAQPIYAQAVVQEAPAQFVQSGKYGGAAGGGMQASGF